MKRILKSLAWNLGLPLGLFCGMYFFYPFRQSFEMDFDEGVNLIKALLLLRGFPLYRLVWSDQPPLFTYLLAGEFRLAGLSVNAARLLVLLFSCVLFWGITHYLRLVWGDLHALAGAFLLLLLPGYLSLSVSAMIGLPALTWAMLALVALAYWHRRHAYPWLVASALALSLAALTKLFTGILAPVFAVGIFAGEFARLRGNGRWLKALLPALLPAAAWSAIFALVVAGVLLITVGPANLSQLIAPHLTAFENRLFQEVGAYTLQDQLGGAWWVLGLALLGLAFALRTHRWLALYPAAWMASGFLLLWRESPVWAHQTLLVTLPAVILAGGAVGEALGGLASAFKLHRLRAPQNLFYALTLLVMGVFMVVSLPRFVSGFQVDAYWGEQGLKATSTEYRLLKLIDKYAPRTQWLVTDMPMYAFRTRLAVPPELGAFTSKRVYTGNLTEAELLEALETYQPEQVLFGRFEFPGLQSYLDEHYQLVQAHDQTHLYIRKDLLQ